MNHLFRLLIIIGSILGVARLSAADTMNTKSDILASYVKISAAFAADDLAAAQTASSALAEHAGMSDYKDLTPKATAVAKAANIDTARDAFKGLSAAVEPLAAGEKAYVVMYCPMADSDWIQAKGKTKNPYFGKNMLSCGGPKKSS